MSYEDLQMFNTNLLFTFGLLTIVVTKCGFQGVLSTGFCCSFGESGAKIFLYLRYLVRASF